MVDQRTSYCEPVWAVVGLYLLFTTERSIMSMASVVRPLMEISLSGIKFGNRSRPIGLVVDITSSFTWHVLFAIQDAQNRPVSRVVFICQIANSDPIEEFRQQFVCICYLPFQVT